MNKIISKINILILAALMAIPSFASASFFEAKTLPASGITETSARISGTVSFDEGLGTVWFEYGTTSSLGDRTNNNSYVSKYEGYPQSSERTIASLAPNTTYYFRMCLESSFYGETCGNTLSFKTKASPVVATATTVVSTSQSNTSSNSSSSSSVKPKTSSVKKDEVKNTFESSQSASAIGATSGGSFLPNTFLEWLATIAIIFMIVMFGRYLYVKRQIEIEEEEKRKQEELIRAQAA